MLRVENGFQNLQVENKLSKKVKNGRFIHFDARMLFFNRIDFFHISP
jgi:hypothetical protein